MKINIIGLDYLILLSESLILAKNEKTFDNIICGFVIGILHFSEIR